MAFAVAHWNVQSGFGKAGFTGPCAFTPGSNCATNSWGGGTGPMPTILRQAVRDTPDCVALTLNEAWGCATPQAVASVLGSPWAVVRWANTALERQGVALLAKFGRAAAVEDRSIPSTPTAPKWVLRAPIFVDAAKTTVVQVYVFHFGNDRMAEQADVTLAFLNERSGERQIAIGDFNITAASAGYTTTLGRWRDAGLTDVWPATNGSASGFTSTWNNGQGSPVNNLYKRIDYVWVRNVAPLAMVRFSATHTPGLCVPADHAGILATLSESGTTAPPAPTITGPVPAGATSVSGTGRASASLTLRVNGTARPAVVVASSGAWTVTLAAAAVGGDVLTATQTLGGATSPTSAAVTVNSVAPPAPAVAGPLVAGATTVGGTGQAGATLTLRVNGASRATTTVGTGGGWSVATAALVAGEVVTAVQTAAGLTSAASAAVTVTPAAQPAEVGVQLTGVAPGETVAGARPIGVLVTNLDASRIRQVDFLLDGVPVRLDTTAPYCLAGDAGLGCALYDTRALTGTTAAPAEHTLTATVTFDTPPAAPTLTGPLVAGQTTVTGTGMPEATVTVLVNTGARGTAAVSGAGTWTAAVSPALGAGDTVTATQTIGALVSAASGALTVGAVDAPPPPTGGVGDVPPTAGPGGLGWPDPNGPGVGTIIRLLGAGGLGSGTASRGDFDPTTAPTEIAIRAGNSEGAWGWQGGYGFEQPGGREDHYPYGPETGTVTVDGVVHHVLPEGAASIATTKFLRWRQMEPQFAADLHLPGDTKVVAFEYKDGLFPASANPHFTGSPAGVRIGIHPTATAPAGTVLLGHLEAKRDRKWKRRSFVIPPGAPLETDGRLRLRIGREPGFWSLWGSCLMHRILIHRTNASGIPPRPDEVGWWPAIREVLPTGDLRDRRTGGPLVPYFTGIAQDATHLASYDIPERVGANGNFLPMAPDGAGNRDWTARAVVFNGGTHAQYGVLRQLENQKTAGRLGVPHQHGTQIEAWVTRLGIAQNWGGAGYQELYAQHKSWRGHIAVWRKFCREVVATEPAIPFLYLRDEWDHTFPNWGGTEELVRELRAVANVEVPTVPTAVLAQGWKQLNMAASVDLADLVMIDHYPDSETDLPALVSFAMECERVTGARGVIGVLAFRGARFFSLADSRCNRSAWKSADLLEKAAYIWFVHHALGIWLFGESADFGGCPTDPTITTAEVAAYYDSFDGPSQRFLALADILHPSATTLGRVRARNTETKDFRFPFLAEGTLTMTYDGVSALDRQAPAGGRRVLVTMHERAATASGVTLTVAGVAEGTVVPVFDEARTVTIGPGGTLTDTWGPWQPHVYELAAGA